MTKYCIMRECENIHSWISLGGNLTFSHQDGSYSLNNDLLWWLVTSPIFLCCQGLIARKIVELFGYNCGIQPFYAACHFNELSRGSVLCLSNTSFETVISQTTTHFFADIGDHGVRRGDTGQIPAQW
jgi:hypothetical protein